MAFEVERHLTTLRAKNQEILVKGKTLFNGYVTKRLITPFDKKGWFHTGDLGILTKGKYLRVIGRKDNMFISGGENIQPEEIEKHILKLKGIADAIVVPKKDKQGKTARGTSCF